MHTVSVRDLQSRSVWALVLLLASLLTGCATPQESSVAALTPTTPALATAASTPAAVARVESPATARALPSPTVTPTATATATATPPPRVRVAVPGTWREATEAAVAQLRAEGSAWQWEVVDGAGELTLAQGETGETVLVEPLILAVPFTTEWEATSLEKAQEIIAKGHELVTVLPWHALTPALKALRVDGRFAADTGYPLQTTWTLSAATGFEGAAAELGPALAAEMAAPAVHMAAVGDIMLDRSLGYALSLGNVGYPFEDVAPVLQGADVTVGNVESALGDVGEPEAKRYPFRAPPEAAAALAQAGFDVVSLANNHGMDYGSEALLQALALLRGANVATVGAGANEQAARAPAIVEVEGLRLAFLGYVNVPVEALSGFDTASWTATAEGPGLAWAAPETVRADVEAVKDDVDLVVVVLHSGYEYVAAPSEPQMAAARAAIDSGADLVLGHHAHILQGIEFYGDGVIVYGMGNFAFEIDGPPETGIFHLWLDETGVRQIALEPAIVQFGGQPRLATEWEATPIWRQVYYLTNVLNQP